MKLSRNLTSRAIATLLGISGLSACTGINEARQEHERIHGEAAAQLADTPKSQAVVATHSGAWLMGEEIAASKPQPELMNNPVLFNQKMAASLSDIGAWLAEQISVPVVIDPSVYARSGTSSTANVTPIRAAAGTAPALALPTPGTVLRMPELPLGLSTGLGSSASAPTPQASGANEAPVVPLTYFKGNLGGFLDVVDAHYGVWSRYQNGTIMFFKTETRMYTLPSLSEASSMSGSITTGSDGSSSGSGVGPSGGSGALNAAPSSGSSSGNSGSGTQTMTLSASVNPWQTLSATASAVAGLDAKVVVDNNLGVLVVTGTPPQCDRVGEWMKGVDAMYRKQVAIDVKVYQVQINREDNYGMNLTLAYQSAGAHTGLSVTGASPPTISSSSTPMTFGASILSGSLSGSQVAVQALSTLGDVSQVVGRSGITQNGKVLSLQAATQQGYVQSNQTTLAANVGATSSLQTGTVVPGFTSSFLPKMVDGRILIDFDMTLSELIQLKTFSSGTGSNASSVQLPTMQITRFEQSVSLKPGQALVLTGMRQQTASVTNNGVGSPNVPLLGGGVDAQKGDTIIAVVISARLL
jgi:type IVB pilus formation R64 PilN family outer membrane protein